MEQSLSIKNNSNLTKIQLALNWIESKTKPVVNKLINSGINNRFSNWLLSKSSDVVKSCPSYFNKNKLIETTEHSPLEVSLIKIESNDSNAKKLFKKFAAIAFIVNALINVSAPAINSYNQSNNFNNPEQNIIENLSKYINVSSDAKHELLALATPTKQLNYAVFKNSDSNALFTAYPKLFGKIPYISFCNLPTPISNCNQLAKQLGVSKFYIKRDDQTGKKLDNSKSLFGGNKPRKLEFMLADAIAHNADTVLTFGCAGSNHALATAIYAKELGLKSILMLKPQWNSHVVRRNLLLDLDSQADITFSNNNSVRAMNTVSKFFEYKNNTGSFPYVIPTGASCPLGSLGFVNAMFELKEQIDSGIMPEPSKIYVPVGSSGTFAGVLLGAKAVGLKSKIIGVTVEPEEVANEFSDKIQSIFKDASMLLNNADQNFEEFTINSDELNLIYTQAGTDYALFTKDGIDAIKLLYDVEGIKLDGVYTGKAFAGLIEDLNKSKSNDDTILFWNTFSSDSFEEITTGRDYRNLPKPFHIYFEQDVQELDRR